MKTKTLKKMFKFINRELFDNMLDMPYLAVLSSKQTKKLHPVPIDGIFIGNQGDDYCCIGIHKDLTKNQAFDTMVHEMIHQHLIDKFDYAGHGKRFKKMCRKAIDTFYYNVL